LRYRVFIVANFLNLSLRAQRGSPSPRTAKMDGRAALAMAVFGIASLQLSASALDPSNGYHRTTDC
jgi:hypothetical protein